MTLKELQIGKSAVVDAVGGTGRPAAAFSGYGPDPRREVTLVKLAPMGDPMELRIHGYELTLRLEDAAQIEITPTEGPAAAPARREIRWWSIRVWARAARTTPNRASIPCRMARP